MKNLTKVLVIVLIAAFICSGCSKKPTQEMNSAQTAIENLTKEGAAFYAKDEFRKLNDELAAAQEEVKIQEKKLLKNFSKAKGMFSRVKANAEALTTAIPKIKEAKNAIEGLIREGAGIYAREEIKKINEEFAAALNEMKNQGTNALRDYGKSIEMLTKLKENAETIKPILAAKKEEAKNNTITAQTEAKAAIEEAKAILNKAPKKGSSEIEALRTSLKGIEAALGEVQRAMDAGNYINANERSKAIKEKAQAITTQAKQVLEKAKAKKPPTQKKG